MYSGYGGLYSSLKTNWEGSSSALTTTAGLTDDGTVGGMFCENYV